MGEKQSAPNKNEKRKPRSRRAPPELELDALLERIDELEAELDLELTQRRLLVESIHGLVGSLQSCLPLRPVPHEAAADVSALEALSFAEMPARTLSALPTLGPCPASDADLQDIVDAAVLTVHLENVNFDNDTKLGAGGLGWKNARKRAAFNHVRAGLQDEGCRFGAQPGDFTTLETVGDMVALARARSFVSQ